MHTKILAVAVLVTLAWSAAEARAEAGTDGVLVYGAAKKHEREVVASTVTDVVHGAAWSLIETPFSANEIAAIKSCLILDHPWPCLEPTTEAKGIARFVAVEVAPVASPAKDLGVQIEVIAQIVMRGGEGIPTTERRYCNKCNDAVLVETTRDVIKRVLDAMPKAPVDVVTTALDLRSVPTGASIKIDGLANGQTDRVVPTTAGKHEVRFERSGYLPAVETVTVERGKTAPLTVTLKPIATTTRPPDPPPRSRLVPALVIGAGAAIAVTGGLLIAIDQDPPPIGQERTATYRQTAPLGLGLVIGGAAVAGLGVYLLLRHHDDPPSSTPTVTLVPSGGVVGWAGTF